ncbi:hypothetical protein RMATCC62417_13823 [Rhizopus microsporus]|nr:hypothetical protein RMATCC62417_13823 [Rhizopus microsporus]
MQVHHNEMDSIHGLPEVVPQLPSIFLLFSSYSVFGSFQKTWIVVKRAPRPRGEEKKQACLLLLKEMVASEGAVSPLGYVVIVYG